MPRLAVKKTRLPAKKSRMPLLSTLKRVKRHHLKHVLVNLSDECIDDICRVLHVAFYTYRPLAKKRNLNKLMDKHKRHYIRLTDKLTPIATRRKILNKQAVTGVLTSVLSKLVPMLEKGKLSPSSVLRKKK